MVWIENFSLSIRSRGKSREEKMTAEKILIASGTRPIIPKIKGLLGTGFITNDEALSLSQQPRVLTIIGGGYIACELAHFFGSLGTTINIIQKSEALIPNEDEEVSKKFTEIFSRKYNVYLECNTEFVSRSNYNDLSEFSVIAKKSKGEEIEIKSDQLLVAAGREPNSDHLDVQKTGVNLDKKGFIVVDKYLETQCKRHLRNR